MLDSIPAATARAKLAMGCTVDRALTSGYLAFPLRLSGSPDIFLPLCIRTTVTKTSPRSFPM
jgi:hypothetical protein